jgi:hypothetical protein
VAIVLAPTEKFEKGDFVQGSLWKTMRNFQSQLWEILSSYKLRYVYVLLLTLCVSALNWAMPLLLKTTIDSGIMIWHDGRGDKNKKLVITNSSFDAKTPTLLGRYHHDSQFYLIKCKMSKNVLDGNIHYAYSDKVLDPCPWGLRTYYYGCTREGGHSGWLNDNLKEAENAPEFYGVTAKWTFNGKWDPEQRIRDLWNVLAY